MKLYIAGKTDFLNVLTAQLNLYTSENALVQSTGTVDTNLIALYKALGGGWEKDSVSLRSNDRARVGQSDLRSDKQAKKEVTD
jgi:outer membrane protein TolC